MVAADFGHNCSSVRRLKKAGSMFWFTLLAILKGAIKRMRNFSKREDNPAGCLDTEIWRENALAIVLCRQF